MIRLFVGIDPPDRIKQSLIDLMGNIAGARWQSHEQLHITLRFIGEVDHHTANDVVAALSTLHHPRFEVAVAGTGSFDKRGRLHTLWAGVEPEAPLRTLHNKVDQSLKYVGMKPDTRQFRPHVTLARLGSLTGPLHGFLETNGGLSLPPFVVDAVCLYESQLTSAGPAYTIVERYGLD